MTDSLPVASMQDVADDGTAFWELVTEGNRCLGDGDTPGVGSGGHGDTNSPSP